MYLTTSEPRRSLQFTNFPPSLNRPPLSIKLSLFIFLMEHDDNDDEYLLEPVDHLRDGQPPPAFRDCRQIGDVTVPAAVADGVDQFEDMPHTRVTCEELSEEYSRYRDRPLEYMQALEHKRKLDLEPDIIPSDHPGLLWKTSYRMDGFLVIGRVGHCLQPIMPDDLGQMGLALSTCLRDASTSLRDRHLSFDFDINGRTYKIGEYSGKQAYLVFQPLDPNDEPPEVSGTGTAVATLLRYQFAALWAKCVSVASHSNVQCDEWKIVIKELQDLHDVSNIL